MRDSIRLGRIAGVSVGLNWSLVVMVALVAGGLADNRFPFDAPGRPTAAYVLAGALTAVGLFAGVLFHELGHAMVARRFGLPVDGITLNWMGGVTRIEGDAPRPRTEFAVAVIGPVISLLFGGLLWGVRAWVGGGSPLVLSALGWLAGINVILAVFNILPAAPLDGGKVMHSAVWAVTGDRWKATRAAVGAGMALGAVMIFAGFAMTTRATYSMNGLFVSFIGWWLLASARAERSAGAVQHALDGVRMGDVMRPVGSAPGWITVRSFVDSYAGGRPGWVWMLENWGGGYGGFVLGDAVGAVPLPQWDFARPIDIAIPVSASAGAGPGEAALDVLGRMGGKQVILVVDGGRTVGAVLPSDIEGLVRMGGRRPVGSRGWNLTRG
jgi:Zn-dependent protease